MIGRGLTLVNAAGCLILGLLLILQWHKERALDDRIQDLKVSLVAAQDQHAAARERAEVLESEQQMLKESIESLQKAAEASGKLLAERDAQIATLETQVAALNEQLKTWQSALTLRDERIHSLNTDLTNARRRLDDAIAKLKAAR